MTDFEKIQIKSRNAILFLENHPAVTPFGLFNCLTFSIHKVCKRGYDECVKKMGIEIRQNSKIAKKFKDKMKKEIDDFVKKYSTKSNKNLINLEKQLITLNVSYQEAFGELWKFDHIEYWGELNFDVYYGDTSKEDSDFKDWISYSGIEDGGRTFEEMIVKLSNKFKKIFGSFSREDFLTEREKKNHEKQMPMIFGKKTMKRNTKYIKVTDSQLNRRWLKWFSKTDYCKKNWPDILKVEKI